MNMKIAIMTWHHYHNYGTALQVTALSEYLKSEGHSVDIIDYHPGRTEKTIYDYSIPATIKRFFKKFASKNNYENRDECYNSESREKKFNAFLNINSFTCNCDNLADLEQLNVKYDAFVCGSDQIWSPNNLDPHYYLDFVKDKGKKIAYAPSIGMMTISNKYIADEMKKLILDFDALSVREDQGAKIIYKLTNKKAKVVLDPTFLIEKKKWQKLCEVNVENTEPAYLLAYMLGINEKHWSEIYRVANQKGLAVKVIPVFKKDLTRQGCVEGIGPKEFVNLVSNASYICTDSFHGMVFSLIFEKNFTIFERFNKGNEVNQNSRVYNIIKLTKLKERLVKYNGSIKNTENIDYAKVNAILEANRKISKKFLQNAVNNIKTNVKKEINHVLSNNVLCCGCGSCANICSKKAIRIKLNDDGFLMPVVDENKCSNCGMCVKVCPFEGKNKGTLSENLNLYSYKDNDLDVLKKSSSGGFAHRLSRILIKNGYAIIGSTFDVNEQRAKHILVKDIDELHKLQGSKYLQSDFSSMYELIKSCETPVAVFGTPCQIAAAKKTFKSRNDILYVDLICHGVPSYNSFKKYKATLAKTDFGADKDFEIVFRDKLRGWRDIYIYTRCNGKELSQHQNEDQFFRAFESTSCYAKSCYDCRWRNNTVADIRIGDYWGPRFETDETGVSMVLTATEKGEEMLCMLDKTKVGTMMKQDIYDYITYQQQENQLKPAFYDELMQKLSDEKVEIEYILDKYVQPFEHNQRMKKSDKIKKIINYYR